MDADELADLAPELPRDVVHELMEALDSQQRERVRSALSYDEDQVGALMDFEMVTIREDVSLEVVLRYLRRLKELPGHTDKLFVVDYEGILKGVLPIKRLLVNDPEKKVADVMASDPVGFHPDEDAYDAAQAFERYDLISAPVVDKNGKLIGRLTIDEMVDLIREESETEVLNMAGLREEEDIFASVWRSLRNRWAWLAVNLITAFIASRVIGLFEGSIEKLVALAALMPIVAGIGGNSGNQTITMIVRAMALDQVNTGNTSRLMRKELAVALINGVVWGGVIGIVAYLLYDSWSLGVVMTAAMTLNLLLAALMVALIKKSQRNLLSLFFLVAALFVSLLIFMSSDSYQILVERNRSAVASEGSPVTRAFSSLYAFTRVIDDAPLWGHGIGSGTNAASAILRAGRVARRGVFAAEDEWSRIILELGLPIGALFILFRIFLLIWLLLKAYKALIRQGTGVPLLLCGFLAPILFNGS